MWVGGGGGADCLVGSINVLIILSTYLRHLMPSTLELSQERASSERLCGIKRETVFAILSISQENNTKVKKAERMQAGNYSDVKCVLSLCVCVLIYCSVGMSLINSRKEIAKQWSQKNPILLMRELINVRFYFNEETCTSGCLRSWIPPRVIMLFRMKDCFCVV